RALHSNETLSCLDLCLTSCSDLGLTSIADCLKVNRTLCYLNLLANPFNSDGIQKLGEALKVNRNLICLCLSSSAMRQSDQSYLEFITKIRDNTSLVELRGHQEFKSQQFLHDNQCRFQVQVRMSLIMKIRSMKVAGCFDFFLLHEIIPMA